MMPTTSSATANGNQKTLTRTVSVSSVSPAPRFTVTVASCHGGHEQCGFGTLIVTSVTLRLPPPATSSARSALVSPSLLSVIGPVSGFLHENNCLPIRAFFHLNSAVIGSGTWFIGSEIVRLLTAPPARTE